MNADQNSPQVQALLQQVSAKLNIPPETLRAELQAGRFDQALRNMRPQEQAVFQQLLADPKRLDQIMNSKQARALYEKLKG